MNRKKLSIIFFGAISAIFALDATTYMPGFKPMGGGKSSKSGHKKHRERGHGSQMAQPKGKL